MEAKKKKRAKIGGIKVGNNSTVRYLKGTSYETNKSAVNVGGYEYVVMKLWQWSKNGGFSTVDQKNAGKIYNNVYDLSPTSFIYSRETVPILPMKQALLRGDPKPTETNT